MHEFLANGRGLSMPVGDDHRAQFDATAGRRLATGALWDQAKVYTGYVDAPGHLL